MEAAVLLNHQCPWRDEADSLRDELADVKAKLAALQHHVWGKKSERLPPVEKELKASEDEQDKAARKAAAREKRKERQKRKAEAAITRVVPHLIPEEQRVCPCCGNRELTPLGKGRQSVVYEYIPARFERQVHVQEQLVCSCGGCVLTAPGPQRVVEKGDYGPGFIAHVVTAKCADSTPLHRLGKALERGGVPMARSTLVDLFHRAAEALAPLAARLLLHVRAAEVVWADETPLKVLAKEKTRQGYIWTFLTVTDADEWLVAYRYSPTRSGKTPVDVLGGSKGCLVVDAYTGYNAVTTPEGRARVGCMSHCRRKLFSALTSAPEAREGLDIIRELYRVEAEAKKAGIVRTPAHRALRQLCSLPLMVKLEAWLEAQAPLHPPKSPIGKAISYMRGQWEALSRFVNDEHLPLDNNRSEASLRRVALGRRNFLFVGHDQAGENLAGLYALVATCEANGINPELYLADVLLRVQTHPNSQIDELLPLQWARAAESS